MSEHISPARLTVVIPTFRRIDGCTKAMRSIFNQSFRFREQLNLIVVDNDPAGSALDAIRVQAQDAPQHVKVKVLHAPDAGVANARNAAMDVVKTQLVAFLDDDQSAPYNWLELLMDTHAHYPAAVTFGPVHTKLPESVVNHLGYLEAFFARDPDHEEGYIDTFYGCGNCLLDLERLPALNPMFNPAMNTSGGEDDLLFAAVERTNGRFAWSAGAFVNEHVPSQRAHLNYTLRRAFAYGQGPCTLALQSGHRNFAKLFYWMVVGLGQSIVFGTVAGWMYLTGHPGRAFWLDRTVRGLGKVFWWKNYHFYGAASLATVPDSSDVGFLGGSEAPADV